MGPINRSTGGAAVEAPIDAAGALIGTWPQYPWTDALSTRVGYTFGLNLVGPSLTVYIFGAPNIIQHTVDPVYPEATVSP